MDVAAIKPGHGTYRFGQMILVRSSGNLDDYLGWPPTAPGD
jgi:hypothetical protein